MTKVEAENYRRLEAFENNVNVLARALGRLLNDHLFLLEQCKDVLTDRHPEAKALLQKTVNQYFEE